MAESKPQPEPSWVYLRHVCVDGSVQSGRKENCSLCQ